MRGFLEERWPEIVAAAGFALLCAAIVIAWL